MTFNVSLRTPEKFISLFLEEQASRQTRPLFIKTQSNLVKKLLLLEPEEPYTLDTRKFLHVLETDEHPPISAET